MYGKYQSIQYVVHKNGLDNTLTDTNKRYRHAFDHMAVDGVVAVQSRQPVPGVDDVELACR